MSKNGELGFTYNIQKVVVSVVKMLIEILLGTEGFLTVSTFPFINVHVNLVLFLISEHIIFRMKPTSARNPVLFLLHKRHQILQEPQS